MMKATAKKTAAREPAASAARPIVAIRAVQPERPPNSLADPFVRKHARTTSAIEAALRRAMPALRKAAKGQEPYAVAIYTSGTSRFGYAYVSANTGVGLEGAARKYLENDPTSTLERERARLRWSPCDWKHHAFTKIPGLGLGTLLAIRSRAEDAAIWEAFALALERCERSGVFGTGEARERVTLAILCGDMDARFLMKGVRRLNPPAVVARVQREWRAGA